MKKFILAIAAASAMLTVVVPSVSSAYPPDPVTTTTQAGSGLVDTTSTLSPGSTVAPDVALPATGAGGVGRTTTLAATIAFVGIGVIVVSQTRRRPRRS